MASAVTAIVDGFSYQAFWFWLQACDLLRHEPDVSQVGFEVDEYVAFDDVAVEYTRPVPDGVGGEVTGRYYSIKYSVDYAKEISAASLGDPALINAQTISLLERLRDAVRKMETDGKSHLFVLAAPWGLASEDPIRKLVEPGTGKLRLDVLFDGTGPRGAMGSLRAAWTKLLKLKSEGDLRPILSRLRLELRPQTIDAHRSELSILLASVGLAPIQKSELVVQYFPLAYEMRKTGAKWFDAKVIRSECKRQGLVRAEGPAKARAATQLGIRSFMGLADGLGAQVDAMLCVVNHFKGRTPVAADVWSDHIPANLYNFLQKNLKLNGQYDLHLHCFGSMAFLAGYLSDPGLGLSAGIVQRQYGKPPEVWTVDLGAVKTEVPGWKLSIENIGAGSEYAVAVSLTHDTKARVIQYCRESLPGVGKVLVAEPTSGPSFTAASSGTHVFALAEQLKNVITRQCGDRKGKLHLFWAAPNAFAYYLGQVSRPLGACRLYEFDMADQTYSSSLDVSPKLKLESVN